MINILRSLIDKVNNTEEVNNESRDENRKKKNTRNKDTVA